MKYVNGAFCVILLLFAGVQYNDPDALFWMPVYLVPAVWSGVAAYRPGLLRGRWPSLGLALSVLLAVAGTIYFWPQDPGWWRQDVWWEQEAAREGMGVMIVTLTLLLVLYSWSNARRRDLR